MESYFEQKPHSKAGGEKAADYGGFGMLSPQVTRILDDLEDHSSSDEDDHSSDSLSEEERKGRTKDKAQGPPQKTKTSPLPAGSPRVRVPPPRPGLGKDRPPHFARFHSLRSMLFSSNIQDKMAQDEQYTQMDAEAKWKADHEKRRASNRPRTPPSPTESPTKEGFIHKVGSKLKRIGSKEGPSMHSISEDDESTASDDARAGAVELSKKHDEKQVSDDDSIHHSDVEDLVRWVSRRDPPSDGEARKGRQKQEAGKKISTHDNGHESLGHEDVDELVRWVSRKEGPREEEIEPRQDYSDISTEPDSEVDGRGRERRSMDDEDANELVQWISRRDRDNAGPVRGTKVVKNPRKEESDGQDSDAAELMRWITRHDDTSGESLASTEQLPKKHGNMTVWEKREDSDKAKVGIEHDKGSLGHEDINELVNWVSQRDSRQRDFEGKEPLSHVSSDQAHDETTRDDDISKWKKEEDEKRGDVGMNVREDKGSLAHEDVEELVKWVSRK